MKEIIKEEDEVVKQDFNFNNLTELYINTLIPKMEYHDNEKDGKLEEYWRLEWDGVFNPKNTEFHLFNLIEQKYLIAEEIEKTVKVEYYDTNEKKQKFKFEKYKINKLTWVIDKVIGKGWKIQVTTPELQCNEADARQKKCTSSLTETEIMNLNMKYKETMDVEIIQELINDKCKTLLKELQSACNKDTKNAIEKRRGDFKDQIEELRKKDIMSLSENAWLFSPNIGKYGEFLISNPAPDASKWIDFGGRDFNKYKFKIMLWGPDGPVEGENVKPIDKNNNTIVIARETKSGNIEYLKNVVDDNDNGFVWLSNENGEVILNGE